MCRMRSVFQTREALQVVGQDHADEYPLARDAQSVRRARRIVSDLLVDGDRPAVLDTALLLVSELVGNAVRYGEEPIKLDVRRENEQLTIGVSDAGPQLPVLPPPSSASEGVASEAAHERHVDEPVGGRGLRLIATLADCCGVERRNSDKRVWFALRDLPLRE